MSSRSRSTFSTDLIANGAEFRLSDVDVEFGATAALRSASLEIRHGEAVGIVGPSGSGKSTLLRLLNGSTRPTSGIVSVGGSDLARVSRRELRHTRASLGFVHQDLSLVPNLRVVQNVMAGQLGHMSGLGWFGSMFWPGRSATERVYALLDRVGIPEKLYERTHTLSGGQKQRVAIARALYQRPVALVADEPVASVDPARARDTIALLTKISREENITLVMSLHNLELAREFLPRLIGLRGGRIVFDKPSAEIGDDEFVALYDLRPEEMLADGA